MAAYQFANTPTPASPSTPWTTLNGAILAGATSLTVTSNTPFPALSQFDILIESEWCLVTAGAGTNTWTVTRGMYGSTAAAHANGAGVFHVLTAAGLTGAASAAAAGSNTWVQYNNAGVFGADLNLSRDAANNLLWVGGIPRVLNFGPSSGPDGSTVLAAISPLTYQIFPLIATSAADGFAENEIDYMFIAASGDKNPFDGTAATPGAAYEYANIYAQLDPTNAASQEYGVQLRNGNGVSWTNVIRGTANGDVKLSSTAFPEVWGLTIAGASGNVVARGTVTATDFIVAGSAFKTDTTDGHQGFVQAYDVDGAAYKTFATLTNGNTPTFVITPPSGGTVTVNATTLQQGGNTLTLSGNLTTTGAFNPTFAIPSSSTWTFPSGGGTLALTTISALTGPVTITEAVGSSGLTIAGATQTAVFPALSITQTWNSGAMIGVLIRGNVTNTASVAATSLLIDLQNGGTPKFQIAAAQSANYGSLRLSANGGHPQFIPSPETTAMMVTRQDGITSYLDMAARAHLANSTGYFGWASSTTSFGTIDTFLYREAAAIIQMGADVNGAAVAQTFKAHDGITGTDIAGANLTIAGGRGTSAGAPGNLIFQTATALSTGTTAQTLATRLTLAQATLTFADAVDMAFNATTGTKIGTATTQKLGFYNATPVVQGASVADASGGAIIDAEARTAINALISRIEATGLIATV